MIKIMAYVTASYQNIDLLRRCLNSIYRSRKVLEDRKDIDIHVVTCDFGPDAIIEDSFLKYRGSYIFNPGGSFQDNVNIGMQLCKDDHYDLFFYFNDDIVINKYFFENALEFYFSGNGNSEIGFIGGASQVGGWNETVERVPEPRPHVKMLFDVRRLNWEASACVIPVKVIEEVGYLDELFGRIGLCADNEYLFRIRKAGYKTVRYEGCTFFHVKAATQSKIRDPFDPKDPWRARAVKYFLMKWGINIDNDSVTDQDCFDSPFNGASVEYIDEDKIKIDGKLYDLKEMFGV